MNCEGGNDKGKFYLMAKVIFLSLLIVSHKRGGGLKYKISGKAGDSRS